MQYKYLINDTVRLQQFTITIEDTNCLAYEVTESDTDNLIMRMFSDIRYQFIKLNSNIDKGEE